MISDSGSRILPNILITGVPGSGKTTMTALLTAELNSKLNEKLGTGDKQYFKIVTVGDLINTHKLWTGYDEERNCSIFDIDKLVDLLETFIPQGGYVVDFHSSDFFPERYFDLVVILRCENSVLYKRLEARGYKAEEAYESYKKEIILELNNSQESSMMENILKVFDAIRTRGLLHKLETAK